MGSSELPKIMSIMMCKCIEIPGVTIEIHYLMNQVLEFLKLTNNYTCKLSGLAGGHIYYGDHITERHVYKGHVSRGCIQEGMYTGACI